MRLVLLAVVMLSTGAIAEDCRSVYRQHGISVVFHDKSTFESYIATLPWEDLRAYSNRLTFCSLDASLSPIAQNNFYGATMLISGEEHNRLIHFMHRHELYEGFKAEDAAGAR